MTATKRALNANLVEDIFQRAPFVRNLGIELQSLQSGLCETRIAIRPEMRQQHGFVHAGVVMTLADHTCGGAAAATVADGQDVITIENKVAFLRPAAGTTLLCRAQVLKAGKTLIFAEAEVFVDAAGTRKLVAKASSTLAIIPLHPNT